VARVVAEPAAFTATLDATSRDGWIALHGHDLLGAVAAFDTPGPDAAATLRARARAELALAGLQGDLARLAGVTAERLFTLTQQRAPLPEGSPGYTVAALAARCGGAGDPWSARAPDADRAALAAMGEGFAPRPDTGAASPTPLEARLAAHAAAEVGDLAPLLAAAREPMLLEPVDGYTRQWWDPCVHRSLADAWLGRARGTLGEAGVGAWAEGLEGSLFAAWPDGAALTGQDDWSLLGAEPLPGASDDLEAARDAARDVDAESDAWKRDLGAVADADGAALLSDLKVVDVYRHERLVARARRALVEGRPIQAGVFAQRAVDVASPEVGPLNGPAAYALLAESALRTGRTREALDSLRRIEGGHPEIVGVRELIGDLAVLEGLDRQGDSKED
jgi:hypothetical protein